MVLAACWLSVVLPAVLREKALKMQQLQPFPARNGLLPRNPRSAPGKGRKT